jgi:hypothetical protein
MGPRQRQQPGNVWVWVVVALLLLCLLAGGGCLVLYLTLPPAEAPQWLATAGLGLVALPWAFWTVTCAYRCCCPAAEAAPAGGNAIAERQPSSRRSAVAPLPSSKGLKSARRAEGSSTASSGTRRVRFGEATVLGEEERGAAERDDGSSVQSNESEAPLASS